MAKEKETDLPEDLLLDFSFDGCRLVVHNDNHNTFEWVIKTFIEVLNHNFYQAEQCAMLIHNRGKCAVKNGDYDTLKPLKDAIIERGLKVTIEY
jgi:ATP-dependent Clp protease adaptor protein ClpS